MKTLYIFACFAIVGCGTSGPPSDPSGVGGGAGGGSTSSASTSGTGGGVPCNVICEIANASTTCSGDVCEFVSCLPGYSDCDTAIANGCESRAADDVNNCGVCGLICKTSQSQTASCDVGQCQIPTCFAGYSDCNNDPADGCEIKGEC